MALGFEFRQTMTGTYHRLETPGEEHPLSLTLRAQVHDLKRLLVDPTAELTGEIDARGLADHRPLKGWLQLAPLRYGKIVYELRFPDNAGHGLRLRGEHELEPLRPVETLTTMTGSVFDVEEGDEVARVVLRFHLKRELARVLRSLRAR